MKETTSKIKATLPAYFGEFGGMFVGELLVPALEQLEQAFIDSQSDEEFQTEFNQLLTNYTINHINFKDDFRGKKRLVKLTF